MKTSKLFLSLSLAGLVGACSTITSGTTQPLTVETPYAANASCTLTDSRNGTWRISQTPDTREVRKGDGPMTITCKKTGFITEKVVVQERFAGATLGNILIGGGIGLIVDAASGAAQDYPDVVTVWMKPKTWSSAAQKTEWTEAKAAYELEEKNKYSPKQPDTVKSTGNFN
jgi:hypothetical protein